MMDPKAPAIEGLIQSVCFIRAWWESLKKRPDSFSCKETIAHASCSERCVLFRVASMANSIVPNNNKAFGLYKLYAQAY